MWIEFSIGSGTLYLLLRFFAWFLWQRIYFRLTVLYYNTSYFPIFSTNLSKGKSKQLLQYNFCVLFYAIEFDYYYYLFEKCDFNACITYIFFWIFMTRFSVNHKIHIVSFFIFLHIHCGILYVIRITRNEFLLLFDFENFHIKWQVWQWK